MKEEKVAILSLSLHNSPCIFRVAKIKENVKKKRADTSSAVNE